MWILAGPVAFGAFKLTYKFIFRARASARHEVARGPKLLLLRVFSLGKRSETLFDIFGAQWRYVGSTRMIAGPDLATSAIEPDEFLQFAGGKLKTLFVDGSEAFRTRLSSLDEAPDFDGRHRVNEFFCYDDTWRMVLRRLAASSDAVLMDLRGFSAQTPGCEFEIKELFHLIPLSRVVFVVDATTDRARLEAVLTEATEQLSPASPNDEDSRGQIRFIPVDRIGFVECKSLVRAVCDAAAVA